MRFVRVYVMLIATGDQAVWPMMFVVVWPMMHHYWYAIEMLVISICNKIVLAPVYASYWYSGNTLLCTV